jgi:hypothetical protein
MALGSTQPLTKMNTRGISFGVKVAGAVVTNSGSLNFLEPSGPVQACNGTDLTQLSKNPLGLSRPVMGQTHLNFLEPSGPVQACSGTDLPQLSKNPLGLPRHIMGLTYLSFLRTLWACPGL